MYAELWRRALLLLCFASFSNLAAAPQRTEAVSAELPLLVITGASYAAEWKEPVLPGYRTLNRGIGGQETQQVAARFKQDLEATRPAAVLIWGHVNNIFRAPEGGVEAAKQRAESDYRAMIAEAKALDIEVMIATEVTMGPPMSWSDRFSTFVNELRGKETYRGWVNRNAREVNDALRAYASQQGIRVLDFERALDGGEGYRDGRYAKQDGSHLTPAAYAALTKYTAEQLSR